jgi:hypothetical protein
MKIKKSFKIMFWVLAVAVPLLVGFQIYTAVATNKTETRPYEVLGKYSEIEIRYYPPVNMASVEQPGDLDNRNGNFRVLAGYIFGGNDKGASISMTSPVEMSEAPGGKSRMSFMMPTDLAMDSLPRPRDSRVQLHTSEAFFAVSIRFGGWADRAKIDRKAAELSTWMSGKNLRPSGDRIYLGYNPPYQLVNRRNEVLFPITEADARAFAASNS